MRARAEEVHDLGAPLRGFGPVRAGEKIGVPGTLITHAMPGMERAPLTVRIERVLGHEPRTRAEIALAVGYAGHDLSMGHALALLVSDGHAIRTPAGWRAPH